jgi:putative membrane protein
MVAFGALIALLSFMRYRSIERQLNENTFFPSKWLVALLTIVIFLGSLMLVLYLLPSL